MPPKPTIDVTGFTDEQKRLVASASTLGTGVNITSTPATSIDSITNPPTPFKVPEATSSPIPDTSFLDQAFRETEAERKAQGEVDLSLETLRGLTNQQGQETVRRGELEVAQGIPDISKQLKETYDQIRQNNLEAFTGQQIAEDRRAPNFAIQGDQQSFERQRAVKNFGLSATAEALQGNLALAEQNIQRAIDTEFKPLQSKIDFERDFLQSNKEKLSAAGQKAADKRLAALGERERVIAEQQTLKSNIGNVMLSVAGAGADSGTLAKITGAKTLEEAISYAAPFLNKEDTQVVKFDNGDTALINSQTGEVIKNFGGAKIEDTVNQYSTTGLGGIASVLNAKFSSKFQADNFKNRINTFVNAGDDKGLADYVFSTAIETLPDTDQRKKAFGQYKIVTKLAKLQSALDEYEANGGKTNIFRGTSEDILASVGLVSDPKLRDLAIVIQDTLDGLARDRTGAVITPSEEKFYNRLLPGSFKTAELNKATINGLRGSMSSDLDSALKFQLTGAGFDSIEPYLDSIYGNTTTVGQSAPLNNDLMKKYNSAKAGSVDTGADDVSSTIASWMENLFKGY